MRAVVQRVSSATVSVDSRVVGQIAAGLLVLVGIAADDGPADLEYIASKVRDLRIFPDDAGLMNRSLRESGGGLLVVSQFTLAGDARKGRRPFRTSPHSVNWETKSTAPPASPTERFIFPASSGNTRRSRIFETM